jgi:hypothetical protein
MAEESNGIAWTRTADRASTLQRPPTTTTEAVRHGGTRAETDANATRRCAACSARPPVASQPQPERSSTPGVRTEEKRRTKLRAPLHNFPVPTPRKRLPRRSTYSATGTLPKPVVTMHGGKSVAAVAKIASVVFVTGEPVASVIPPPAKLVRLTIIGRTSETP